MDPNDHFGNILRVFDTLRRRELRRLMEGTPRTTWYEGFAPTDINAFYNPSLNQFSKLVHHHHSAHLNVSSSFLQYFFLAYFNFPFMLQIGLSKLIVPTVIIIYSILKAPKLQIFQLWIIWFRHWA